MLKTAPSFEIYNTSDGGQDGENNRNEDLVQRKMEEALTKTVTIEDSIDGAGGSCEFSFGQRNMGLIEEKVGEGEEEEEEEEEDDGRRSPRMYLASGLGIEVPSSNQGSEVVDHSLPNFEEGENAEEFSERMIDEYPSHPMILRKYAQLLQSKGDLHGAEDYYHRATAADPRDGEALLQYAKLIWELHHDQDRALSYFERAAQAVPHDSNVRSAYACFLWEIDDDKEDKVTGEVEDCCKKKEKPFFGLWYNMNNQNVIKLSTTMCWLSCSILSPNVRSQRFIMFLMFFHAEKEQNSRKVDQSDSGKQKELIEVPDFAAADDDSAEEYYRRIIGEDPCNTVVLKKYAQFLYQSKGDLQGAEEYYLRAVQADPSDGEVISQYAKLVWELHSDCGKAMSYYEQAVRATPENSYVLAAYASFLWEVSGDDEEEDSHMTPHLPEGVVTTA